MSEPVSSGKASLRSKRESKERSQARASSFHHVVYVVYLRNPKGDGKAGYYVGMTGLTPEERFANHKAGIKASSVVKRFGERLVPKLYEHLKPMSYADALAMEKQLFEELKARGYRVFGGH